MLLPLADSFLVPLHGAPLRLLGAPPHFLHDPPDVVAVVLDAELLLDQVGDALCSPQVGAIPV